MSEEYVGLSRRELIKGAIGVGLLAVGAGLFWDGKRRVMASNKKESEQDTRASRQLSEDGETLPNREVGSSVVQGILGRSEMFLAFPSLISGASAALNSGISIDALFLFYKHEAERKKFAIPHSTEVIVFQPSGGSYNIALTENYVDLQSFE